MKHISKTMIVVLVSAAFLIGTVIATVAPIWSSSSGPTTATPPFSISAVNWNDETQPTLARNPTAIHNGDILELSTIITPTTANPQNVTFYYTNVVNPTLNTPIGTNSTTQLVIAGTGLGTSTATYHWTVPANGTYYFIAEIITPT